MTSEELELAVARVATVKRNRPLDWSLADYPGNAYFVELFTGREMTYDQAIEEVQKPVIVRLILMIHGLEFILADRYATAGLRKCILDNNPAIRRALLEDAKFEKPRGKPGPRPRDGKYKGELIIELDALGFTNGQISKMVYGTPAKSNLVSAHLSQRRKKSKSKPPEDGG